MPRKGERRVETHATGSDLAVATLRKRERTTIRKGIYKRRPSNLGANQDYSDPSTHDVSCKYRRRFFVLSERIFRLSAKVCDPLQSGEPSPPLFSGVLPPTEIEIRLPVPRYQFPGNALSSEENFQCLMHRRGRSDLVLFFTSIIAGPMDLMQGNDSEV